MKELWQLAEAIARVRDVEQLISLLERYQNGDLALDELVDHVQALRARLH